MKKVRLRSRLIICVAFLFAAICGYTQDSLLVDTSEVYFIVDEMPTFEDGTDFHEGIRRIVAQNFTYPELPEETEWISNVYFKFVISKDGKIVNREVIIRSSTNKGIYSLFKQEFDRIIDLLPKIRPGKHNGNFVDVRLVIPANFDPNL